MTCESITVPKKYFIVAGSGLSRVSNLNSFDKALLDAGIANYNLVPVSSIIPENCTELEEPVSLKIGSIVYVVMARSDGIGRMKIGAGIGVAKIRKDNILYGVVVESTKYERDLKDDLRKKINEMVKARNAEILDIKFKTKYLDIPEGYYGTVIAAVVFVPY